MPDGSLIFWKSSSKTNFTDRVYYAFFIGISLVLCFRTGRIEQAFVLIGINIICCAEISYLQRMASRSFFWQFLHDWYPLLAFIICFEEVSRLSFLFRDGWQDHYLLAFEARIF